ncbi:hypothetical protein ACJRO7_032345 [Eucalyptus globulus]|uniref:TIR domain-containing protein n=1 Tax=Eucalyptus globulus TaxID=34317 RepID=A0ABD3JKH9_EUCGL
MLDMGIRAYKDDEDLRKGEEFGPKLLQAMEQSKISMPIFSKGYASSIWCLKELVNMVECQKTKGQKIMPIFYDVAPSEVRHLTGGYGEAFHSHEKKKRHDEKIVQEWKDALAVVGQINGWDLQSMSDRREGEFARKVTQKVFNELKKAYLAVSECLVNVDNHVDAIMEMIGAGTSETRIIGIHGMGGIGKTTIAKMIYNKLSHDFENCCFLQDIRETSKGNGIQCLQNQLISVILKTKHMDIKDIHEGTWMIKDRLSNKKVLLLLDDVEEANHINALVGKRDWLGRGSKIIITTRNKDILEVPEVDCSYELSGMDLDQSLQLFSKHAFRKDYPLDNYIIQSKRAIGIARGLPLALEIIGSLLCRTKKEKWDLTLKKLENVPHAAVQRKLKISYDALDVRQQDIFLDIACLFIGYNKDIVVYFWDESKYPKEAMEVLQNMSLIKIEKDNKVWMHNQLRDLGREIVRQQSKMKIEQQSRMWDPKEALDLLRKSEGRKEVEALRLKFDHKGQYHGFKSLSNLKFLVVDGSREYFHVEERLPWHESPSSVPPTNVFQENSDLLPELRWLAWPNIPPTFNIMNFSMKNVVILDLSKSTMTHDWEGWSHMKVMENLKVMDLNNCNCLERTPNFPAHSNLERLILRGCCRLVEIDKSICRLKSLVFLDISWCWDLRRLPNTIGNLESLIELNILKTGIKELPSSIGNLKSLNELNISQMGIQELPHSIGNLESLIELDISKNEIKELPDSIGKLKNLKVVKLNWSPISNIPNALWTIEKLEVIEAITNSCHFDVEIGNHICRNQSLRILKLLRGRIYVVPRLPESLTILELSDLYMNTFPDLSNLTNLKELKMWFEGRDSNGESDGPVEEDLMPLRIGSLHGESDGESDGPVKKDRPWWIGNLSKLESLVLKSPYMTALPTDIRSLLPQLKFLQLWYPNLCCLPSLPSSLSELNLQSKCVAALPTDMSSLLPRLEKLTLYCPNLQCLPSLPSNLSLLHLKSEYVATLPTDVSSLLRLDLLLLQCPNLRCLSSLPSSLSGLYLHDCKLGFSMEDLSNLKTLSTLYIDNCAISEMRGELPPSLGSLLIFDCESLQKLPDLSNLKGLRIVRIERSEKLNVEAISSLCSEKGVKFVGDKTNQREKMTNLDANLNLDLRENLNLDLRQKTEG